MPTPIAKKTISGMNLYGSLNWLVKAAVTGCDKSMPMIKTIIESACATFFRKANNPTVSGNKNAKTSPSYRN